MVITSPSDMEVATEQSLTRKNDFVARADIGALVDRYRSLPPWYTEDRNKDIREWYACKNAVIGSVGPKGGCLSFSDKSVSVKIPEGALSKPILMHCHRDVGQAVDGKNTDLSGHRLIQYSPRLDFGPDGTIFQKPITVRFRHSISKKDWSNGTTKKLKVHHASNGGSRWKHDDTEQCRLDGEWMEITLNHFGTKPESESLRRQETSARQSTQRKVCVVWEWTRKLVNFDMNSLANTKAAIRTKFNIVGDFDILGKVPGDEWHYDIQNDDDLDDFKGAEHFLVKERLNKEKQSDRSAPSKNQRKLSVVSDGKCQKIINIDLNSFAHTKAAIRTKFNIFSDFDLLGKMPGNEHPFEIQDDDDLDDCREAESFLVKRDLNEGWLSDESSNSKVTLKMKFEAHDEFVSIDLECLQNTMNAISHKFNINGDFQLLVKKKGIGKYIDVDDDDVLATLTKDDVLLVERTAQQSSSIEAGPTNPQQQDAPECKVLVEVKIGKTMYPVHEAPPGNSLVVRKETAYLKLDFDLYGVIRNTDVVADCIRLARYAVANNPNISASLGDIVSGVMEITQKTKHAVMKLQMMAGEILEDLVSGVGFLMKHVDSVAMTKFKRTKGNTALLKDRSEEIRQEVDNRRKAINGVLGKVKQETKEHAFRKKVAYEEIQTLEMKELERRVAVAKKDTESSNARIKLHEKKIETDKERVKKALDKTTGCGHGCRYGLCCHGVCPCLPISRSECCYRCCSGRYYWYWSHLCHDHDHGVDDRRVKAEQALQQKAEEDKQKEIAERKKLREEENTAIDELQNYIHDMKLKDGQLPADFTEKALHATDDALRALNASVQSTVDFWDKMNQHCEAMGNTAAIADNVDNIKDDLVEREIYLNSTMFKSEVVRLYAKWVALRHLCEEFDTQIKPFETSIQRSILDYPDPEEARRKIPELISALDTKLLLQKQELALAAADNESIMEGEQ